MKKLSLFFIVTFLVSSCAPAATVIPVMTPAPTQTTMPAPINTSAPTITPIPLPITFKYQDNVPANARRLQEQAANKAYTDFSQFVNLGPITVYTFYDIDLIMDEIFLSINADAGGNMDKSVFRNNWNAGIVGGGASGDTVLINPNHGNWNDTGCYKPKNIAHEMFHMTQARLLQNDLNSSIGSHSPEWLNEGSAEVMGHLVANGMGGCSYQEKIDAWIEGISDKDVSLKDVEGGDFDSKDWFWTAAPLAVVRLIKNSPHQEQSLFEYYAEIGHGKDWHDAFESAFGLSIEEFYGQFEEYHNSIKTTLDTNVCLPQSDSRIKCLGRKPFRDGGYIYLFGIPFGFNTPPDQWTQEASCELANQGYEGSTSAVTFQIYVEQSGQGTCHAEFTSGEGKKFSVDFLAP